MLGPPPYILFKTLQASRSDSYLVSRAKEVPQCRFLLFLSHALLVPLVEPPGGENVRLISLSCESSAPLCLLYNNPIECPFSFDQNIERERRELSNDYLFLDAVFTYHVLLWDHFHTEAS